MPQKLTQAVVEEWISLVSGKIYVRTIWEELGISSVDGKKHLRVILNRIVGKGIIAPNPDGSYRRVDLDLSPIEWQSADPQKVVPLKFPFGLEDYARIYPKSIIIVAGSKNVGKTEYLYGFIKLNMGDFILDLFNSETGAEQMHERFDLLGIPPSAPFKAYERYDNFADVIHPEHISVIDYLDLNSEVYLVGAEIDAIFRKLTTGVAIIGLQKPPPVITYVKGVRKVIDRDLAYGGGFTSKRAALYISMGSNKLKLVYVKTPKKSRVNPTNMAWSFSFNESSPSFNNIQPFIGEDSES